MGFFQGQETLTSLEWILRAVIAFFFLVIVAKMMGQRAISQLRLIDFVIALVLGNIIAHPLSDEKLGMKGSMITTTVLVVLYTGSLFLSLKLPLLEKFLDPSPYPLIKNGEIIYKGLKKAKISITHLLAELRKEKIDDVKKVALALWESDGKISFFLDTQYQPLTPSVYQLKTETFDLPKIIIKDGRIDHKELSQMKIKEEWLINSLRNQYQTKVENVLLATMDQKNNLKVFLYK